METVRTNIETKYHNGRFCYALFKHTYNELTFTEEITRNEGTIFTIDHIPDSKEFKSLKQVFDYLNS